MSDQNMQASGGGPSATESPTGSNRPVPPRRHAWITNRSFERLTGLRRVCMDCGLALEAGERLVEMVCPGKRPEAAS